MYEIVDLIRKYKKFKQDSILKEIIDLLQPIFLKYLKKIPQTYKEDFLQELIMGTHLVIINMKFHECIFEEEKFNFENEQYLSSKGFTLKNIQTIFSNPYLLSFIQDVGIEFFKKAFHNPYKKEFKILFFKFNIRNQFYHILGKRFDSLLATFYRINTNYFLNENRILNLMTNKGIEQVEGIPSKTYACNIRLERYGIEKQDIPFLLLFIDGTYILSQREVAQKLGVSQQSISKRLKIIRNKYHFQL